MKRSTAGYNTVMWLATFTVVTAAAALLQAPLKRALRDKAVESSAYILWGQFEMEPDQHIRDERSREKTTAAQNVKKIVEEDTAGTVNYFGPAEDPRGEKQNYRAETSVSSSVGEGQEALLDTFDLNQF